MFQPNTAELIQIVWVWTSQENGGHNPVQEIADRLMRVGRSNADFGMTKTSNDIWLFLQELAHSDLTFRELSGEVSEDGYMTGQKGYLQKAVAAAIHYYRHRHEPMQKAS